MPKGPLRGGMGAVAGAAVQATRSLAGLPAARKLSQRLLVIPPAGGTLFHCLLDAELGEQAVLATAGAGGNKLAEQRARIKQVFEAAVEHFGAEDPELWLRYTRWQAAQEGQGRNEGGLYWRAVKSLSDPSQFIAAHQAAMLPCRAIAKQ
mmetsp:Transcript_20037/g.55661  ORF Transcript_20037/g.55661 Transcript_20037/m.55661 type:complete len:150 (+) Transcript_20037:233-682(+)